MNHATVTRLIGVYDADGSLLGELRYAARKLAGRGHCSLCDLTHRGVRRRPEWDEVTEHLGVPIELVHRDERSDALAAATTDRIPALLAEAGTQLVALLGPAELEACGADVGEFERRVAAAALEHGLHLGAETR
jgi:hypothetical protein